MLDYNKFFSQLSQLMDYMFRYDIYDFLMESNVPMAFIMGSSDWITPMEMVKEYYTKLENQNKRLVIMDGMGHLPSIDDPKLFSEKVMEILINEKEP